MWVEEGEGRREGETPLVVSETSVKLFAFQDATHANACKCKSFLPGLKGQSEMTGEAGGERARNGVVTEG